MWFIESQKHEAKTAWIDVLIGQWGRFDNGVILLLCLTLQTLAALFKIFITRFTINIFTYWSMSSIYGSLGGRSAMMNLFKNRKCLR